VSKEKIIYYIGGSPCAGKSTVAEILSQKYGLYYFKVDDFLDGYMQAGARKERSICRKAAGRNAEQTWMREPLFQCREEFDIYREIFEFVTEDLKQIDRKGSIVTEGAAYIPELMKQSGIPGSRYISITPTEEFQITHYRKREFVPLVLEGCSDKETAFRNWMDRDILFAQEVQRQCRKEKYVSVINDGTMKIDELAGLVAAHFGLK
jgi:Adenylate kinase and related kinases